MRASTVAMVCLLAASALLGGCLDTDEEPPEPPLTVPDDVAFGAVSGAIARTYAVFPGDYLFDINVGSQPLREATYDVADVASVNLVSQLDGATIDLSLWLPVPPEDGQDEHAEPTIAFPVIVQASPYFPRTDTPSGSQRFGQWIHDVFVPRGYAYVQLAIRSTGDSGGCDDFRGPNMNADLDQAITWIAEQDWSNGNVALIGKSYPGSTPWYAAGTGNPHIKTIVPISGSTNAWEVYNRNGTPEFRSPIIVPNYGVSAASNDERSAANKVENFSCTEVYEGWANGVSSGVTGERIDDAWWDARNAKPAVEQNYEGSILLVHGLEDWNVDPAIALPWTDRLNRSDVHVKHLLGQWQHDHPDRGSDETKRWDWAEILDRWFRYWLNDETELDLGPPVQVQSNDGRWRDEINWPPRDADRLRLHVAPEGLVEGAANATSAWHVLLPGSIAAEQTPLGQVGEPYPIGGTTVLATEFEYAYGPLEEPLHIAGLPNVHLTVQPDEARGYFGAFLYDQAPNGERTRIGWTGMNLRYADGTEDPKPVRPGERIVAKAQLQPLDAFVPANHTLVLVINTDAPDDRVPPASQLAHMPISAGPESVLDLPIVDRPDDWFFVPPAPTS